MTAAPIVVFATRVLIPPDRIAEIERARIAHGAHSGSGDATYHRARTGVAGKGADRRARAGAKKSAGGCAVTLSRAARRKCEDRKCGKNDGMFHFVFSPIDRAWRALRLSACLFRGRAAEVSEGTDTA
jgi:hypothetical protein